MGFIIYNPVLDNVKEVVWLYVQETMSASVSMMKCSDHQPSIGFEQYVLFTLPWYPALLTLVAIWV